MPYQLLILLLIVCLQNLDAQHAGIIAEKERIGLFTDRIMYVSGEKILFTAFLFNPEKLNDTAVSKVLYCELISPDGYRVSGGKYLLNRSKTNGCLQIPSETITGTYYLKAYTKFMRNEGPPSYRFIPIVIINPDKIEVLPSRDEDTDDFSIISDSGRVQSDIISVSTDKELYAKREAVKVNLTINRVVKEQISVLCLSAAPELSINGFDQVISAKDTSFSPESYYPETRGISLTGKLQDKDRGIPLPAKEVNLSIIGDKDFMAMRTDSSGRFFFSLPGHTGNRDIFLCAEDLPGTASDFMIDNDFCPGKVNLPSPPFRLSEMEQNIAFSMALNHLVSSCFKNDSMAQTADHQQIGDSFYGEPSEVIILDKYIELPTLEEYFNELPTEVKVRKSQGRKHFRFFSTQPEMIFYDPLVLIDWVAVDDIDNVLALSPADVSRIELINAPYIKGNIMFGGIISFISKKNDFAGIDLPSSGTFINYKFFEDCKSIIPEDLLPANVPDGRNTLYWNPDITTDPDGQAEFSFHTPDTPGIYMVLLRGITKSGAEFRSYARIEVL